jgi:preprotein translocase subunit SecA
MEEFLKAFDILAKDLTPEQMNKLENIAKDVPNPEKMTAEQATRIVKDLGIDIEKLQKSARRFKAEEHQKKAKEKVGVNEKCPCGSGKKFKVCCRK